MSASSKTPAKKAQKGQGGKRKGAGRPAVHGERTRSSTLQMPEGGWEMLEVVRKGLSRSEWMYQQVLRAYMLEVVKDDLRAKTKCVDSAPE